MAAEEMEGVRRTTSARFCCFFFCFLFHPFCGSQLVASLLRCFESILCCFLFKWTSAKDEKRSSVSRLRCDNSRKFVCFCFVFFLSNRFFVLFSSNFSPISSDEFLFFFPFFFRFAFICVDVFTSVDVRSVWFLFFVFFCGEIETVALFPLEHGQSKQLITDRTLWFSNFLWFFFSWDHLSISLQRGKNNSVTRRPVAGTPVFPLEHTGTRPAIKVDPAISFPFFSIPQKLGKTRSTGGGKVWKKRQDDRSKKKLGKTR